MFIHTALYQEALPIIKFFNLKEDNDKYFKIYKNNKILLINSGLGKINTALALSHIFTKYENFSKNILSIGIAGATKNLSIAELVNVKKIIDKESQKVFHLKDLKNLKNLSCTTSDLPLTNAKTDLADMEASSVYLSCKKFDIRPTILKVVSDFFEPNSVKKEEIENLISININKISTILSTL